MFDLIFSSCSVGQPLLNVALFIWKNVIHFIGFISALPHNFQEPTVVKTGLSVPVCWPVPSLTSPSTRLKRTLSCFQSSTGKNVLWWPWGWWTRLSNRLHWKVPAPYSSLFREKLKAFANYYLPGWFSPPGYWSLKFDNATEKSGTFLSIQCSEWQTKPSCFLNYPSTMLWFAHITPVPAQ